MTRILFVSPTGTLTNGAEKAGYYLMRHLVETGHNVVNVCNTNSDPALDEAAAEYLALMGAAGVEARPVQMGWWTPEDSASYLTEVAATRALVRIIQDLDIELVVTNTSNMPWGALAASLTDVAHFWWLHEFPEENFSYLEDRYDFIADFSSRIFCCSDALTRVVEQKVNAVNKVTPIDTLRPFTPAPASLVTDSSDINQIPSRIVSLGRIEKRKNQTELVQAIGALRRDGIDLPVLFIGGWDEAYLNSVKKTADEESVSDRISFVGFQSEPWKSVNANDIFVQCSITETLGLAFIEAMLLEIPALSSNNAGAVEVDGLLNANALYPLGDIVTLAARIASLLQHSKQAHARARSIGQRATGVLSVQNCCQPMVSAVASFVPGSVRGSVEHLEPYFSQYIDDRSFLIAEKTTVLTNQAQQIARLQSEVDRQARHSQAQQAELTGSYESSTWRVGRAIGTPVRLVRRIFTRIRR